MNIDVKESKRSKDTMTIVLLCTHGLTTNLEKLLDL